MMARLKGLLDWARDILENKGYPSSRTRAEARPERSRPNVPDSPMTAGEHWRRVSGVLEGAITSARNARTMQRAAASQIDAAAYALDLLFEELAAAMPVPRLVPAPVAVVVPARPFANAQPLRPAKAA